MRVSLGLLSGKVGFLGQLGGRSGIVRPRAYNDLFRGKRHILLEPPTSTSKRRQTGGTRSLPVNLNEPAASEALLWHNGLMASTLLRDLAVVMATAAVTTLIFHRLKQPVVIGYIIAGLLIGPYTPPFALVSDLHSIHTMAELGLVLLMFSLGLEFNLPKIRKVGISAGLAALMEVMGMLVIGFLAGQAFGWNRMDSVFLGAILCISSTTIIVKVFMDYKMVQEKFAQVVFGILILEDIVAVIILSVLSGLGVQGGPHASGILVSIFKIGLFVILFLLTGLLAVPRFVHWVAQVHTKEMLGVVTLGLCFTGALVASYFKLSIALGAFLMGAVIAASREAGQVEEWIHPVRDMFSAIFFVSAGLLIQPRLLLDYWVPILIITIVTVVGKALSGAVGSFLVGYDLKTSARVGMSMAQIGEFSFVIATLGVSLNVTSDFLYPLAVAVSSLTTFATPYLIRNSDRLVDKLLAKAPPRVQAALRRYESKVKSAFEKEETGMTAAIFSKYFTRLGIYLAVLAGFVLIAQILSRSLPYGVAADSRLINVGYAMIWLGFALLSLPTFLLVSKYANHVILLIVTRNKFILHYLNVHLFYNILNRLAVWTLCALFLILAARFVADFKWLLAIGLVLLAVDLIFRKRIRLIQEGMENVLDHITGLATSEPARQAVLMTGDKRLLLSDIVEQISISTDSPARHQTIRAAGVREQTGASIVAIYRNGQPVPNPGPDTELLVDDVLVLIGDEDQLEKARTLLVPPQP